MIAAKKVEVNDPSKYNIARLSLICVLFLWPDAIFSAYKPELNSGRFHLPPDEGRWVTLSCADLPAPIRHSALPACHSLNYALVIPRTN